MRILLINKESSEQRGDWNKSSLPLLVSTTNKLAIFIISTLQTLSCECKNESLNGMNKKDNDKPTSSSSIKNQQIKNDIIAALTRQFVSNI